MNGRYRPYVAVAQLCDVHGEKLQWDDGENALQTVLRVRNGQRLVRHRARLFVVMVTDQDRVTLETQAVVTQPNPGQPTATQMKSPSEKQNNLGILVNTSCLSSPPCY